MIEDKKLSIEDRIKLIKLNLEYLDRVEKISGINSLQNLERNFLREELKSLEMKNTTVTKEVRYALDEYRRKYNEFPNTVTMPTELIVRLKAETADTPFLIGQENEDGIGEIFGMEIQESKVMHGVVVVGGVVREVVDE